MTKDEFIKLVKDEYASPEYVAALGLLCADWDVQRACRDFLNELEDFEIALRELGIELG